MVTAQKGEYLKDIKKEGSVLRNEQKGTLIKDEGVKGDPLWKKKKKINEDKEKGILNE